MAAAASSRASSCGLRIQSEFLLYAEHHAVCCCLCDRRRRVRPLRARNRSQRWLPGPSRSPRIIRMESAGLSETHSDNHVDEAQLEDPRAPFSLDLAVLLAGFAFESYNAPAKGEGVSEMDTQECETTYLAKEYVRALYDGQLYVKLKDGSNFPGLDLWGTSDPYVILRLGDCSVRSKTVWATKDPVWNEDLKLNVKDPTSQILKIAAWDANVVTAHRRLGNSAVSLEKRCDGKVHNLGVQLEGMGGGGTVYLEILYRTYAQIEAEKDRGFNFASMFAVDALENAFKSVVGDNQISVGDFMMNFFYRPSQEDEKTESKREGEKVEAAIPTPARGKNMETQESKDRGFEWNPFSIAVQEEPIDMQEAGKSSSEGDWDDNDDEVTYWKKVSEAVSEKLKPLGFDLSSLLSDWDGFKISEDVKTLGLETQEEAESEYVKQGLTLDERRITEDYRTQPGEETRGFGLGSILRLDVSPAQSVESLRKQTEKLLGLWTIFNKSSDLKSIASNRERSTLVNGGTSGRAVSEDKEACDANTAGILSRNEDNRERYATMFSTAESAMEAWALLATTMGGVSLLKSDFKKICFVENAKTDTQVAIWRDERRKRLVVAFRGTEQSKWKDFVTDISLLATGLNPERVGDSRSKDEILVHGGFLNAYDSVRARLLSLVRAAISLSEDASGSYREWQIYVTGHSLGGALATLFALDLATAKLTKDDQIRVTMYNYGSPRVGNRAFAEKYNKTVKDSWRVVNHRDIVPTVPRLMGYCHVAQPIYLSTHDTSLVSDLLDDGYQGDVIGEATPDIIIEEIMKGEQRVLHRLLDTEISMLRAMRDGSAVMQHMEDFYYITLLQRVEARISHSGRQ